MGRLASAGYKSSGSLRLSVSPLRCVSLALPLGPHFTAKVTGIGLRDPKASTLVRGIDELLPPTFKSVHGCGFPFGTVLKPYPALSSSPR